MPDLTPPVAERLREMLHLIQMRAMREFPDHEAFINYVSRVGFDLIDELEGVAR